MPKTYQQIALAQVNEVSEQLLRMYQQNLHDPRRLVDSAEQSITICNKDLRNLQKVDGMAVPSASWNNFARTHEGGRYPAALEMLEEFVRLYQAVPAVQAALHA